MRWLWFGCYFTLAACGSDGPPSGLDSKADLARYPEVVFKQAGLNERYNNATSLSYTHQHGTQVSYTAANGRVYLWYPGNSGVVVGRWKTITDDRGSGRLCFNYPSNSYNPVTRTSGGHWDCTRAADYIWTENEFTRGDPFNLTSQRLSFVMPEGQQTFAELANDAGVAVKPEI